MTEKQTENSERAKSGASAPVPKDHPLMKAWENFKDSDDFANSKRWAAHPEHLDGSLWALFDAGWHAGVSARRCQDCSQQLSEHVCGCPIYPPLGIAGVTCPMRDYRSSDDSR
jgi:hypothetical protein